MTAGKSAPVLARCRRAFAFLVKKHGFADPQTCGGPDGFEIGYARRKDGVQVRISSERFETPFVLVLSTLTNGFGLHEAARLIGARAPTGVREQAAFLRDNVAWVIDRAAETHRRILAAREQETEESCGGVLRLGREHFDFLITEHGFAPPLAATSTTQCSLVYRKEALEVLLAFNHRDEWDEPGVSLIFRAIRRQMGLDEAMAVLLPEAPRPVPAKRLDLADVAASLTERAAFLRRHAGTLLGDCRKVLASVERRRSRLRRRRGRS